MAALSRRAILALAIGVAAAAAPCAGRAQSSGAPDGRAWRELVVLVHGMGRTSMSMAPMARALEEAGFATHSFGYSSTCCAVEELAARLRLALDSLDAPSYDAVHFVGHSLGGIVVRAMLAAGPAPIGAGRIVMIAPPNQGSHEADRFAPYLGWLLRPMSELRTDTAATVRRLPPPTAVEIGIIAGDDDGKVAIPETRLNGASDHIVVDGAHTFLMRSAVVQRHTIAFLRTGRFGDAPRP